MKKSAGVWLVLALLCGVAAQGQQVEKQGKAWLAQFSEAPAVNVNGVWRSPDWGRVSLNQPPGSREVSGEGDDWKIDGVVSGKKVYLLFSDRGKVNYCAILDAESDKSLKGQYSTGMMKPNAKTRPMHLTR